MCGVYYYFFKLLIEFNAMPSIAIEIKNLIRYFETGKETVKALDGINLQIKTGELFGLLGSNGSGKTTLIKILCTLLYPTSGEAFVSGINVVKEPEKIRGKINMVAGEETSGYGILTVRENIWLFSQLYGIESRLAKKRIDELLELLGLTKRAHTRIHKISTGERQKMNLCRGLVTDPDVLFLDEPTVGVDVNSGRTIRDYLLKWMKNNRKTILLTTHNMVEAEEICDRVAIIDEGKILALDTPSNLKQMLKNETILELETDIIKNLSFKYKFSKVDNHEKKISNLRFFLKDESTISDIISELSKKGVKIKSLHKSESKLEDIFIQLVGKNINE
jgi:ABC-2 type transport system ATP-binding protein|tara:strand:- start:62 stop:1063 length:1002 start_codon:yes stop_codon:yes gene_type:complete